MNPGQRRPEIRPSAEWEVASPESQGVDAAKLKIALDYLEQNAGSDGIRELLIIRNGRMIRQGDRSNLVRASFLPSHPSCP